MMTPARPNYLAYDDDEDEVEKLAEKTRERRHQGNTKNHSKVEPLLPWRYPGNDWDWYRPFGLKNPWIDLRTTVLYIGTEEKENMTRALDETLVHKTKRAPRESTLTDNECVALNLFWRKNVRVPILAKVFKVSKNTIYYRALTGNAELLSNLELLQQGQGYERPDRLYWGQAGVGHVRHRRDGRAGRG